MIRPATLEDAAACARIMGAWVAETPWMPMLHTPGEDHAFLCRLIGAGRVTVWDGAAGIDGFVSRAGTELGALYVSACARGQGVGAALLDAAKRASPVLDLWTFEANTGARRFYRREGFAEIGRTDGALNEERLPDIRYRWTSQ